MMKERMPLTHPSFVKTPEEQAATRLRGIEITDNPTSAGWAQHMLASGAAQDPTDYRLVDSTIAAVRAAYQKQLSRAPTQAELAEWVPFTANMDYNRRRAAEVLVELQNRSKLDEISKKIQLR